MAIDPLSPATRAAKRNLLAISAVAITYKVFNVTIETIPIGGLKIDFERGAFTFLIICGLVYFGITFVLYYWIDIKNLERTPHQEVTTDKIKLKLSNFRYRTVQSVCSAIQNQLPPSNSIPAGTSGLDENVFLILEAQEKSLLRRIGCDLRFTVVDNSGGDRQLRFVNVTTEECPAPFRAALDAAVKKIRWYRWRYLPYRLVMFAWTTSVRLTYGFRNYGTDGILPVALMLFAIAAMYDLVSVRWLVNIVPRSMH